MFDLTRKIDFRLWEQNWSGAWTPVTPQLNLGQNPTWPLLEEEANDFAAANPNTNPPTPADPHPNNLESNNVTPKAYPPPATRPGNNMYSVDYPGIPNNTATVPGLIFRYNFSEFMRVKFDGNRPQGAVSGSRVTPFYDWHVTIWVSSNVVQGGTGTWTRNATGNAIGQNHLQNVNDRTGGT